MLEDVGKAATSFGAGGVPVFRGAAVLRQRSELHDRMTNREVADLGPTRIGRDLDDGVLFRADFLEEFAKESRLAHADVADDARADEGALRIDEAIVEPQQIVFATDELEREVRALA